MVSSFPALQSKYRITYYISPPPPHVNYMRKQSSILSVLFNEALCYVLLTKYRTGDKMTKTEFGGAYSTYGVG